LPTNSIAIPGTPIAANLYFMEPADFIFGAALATALFAVIATMVAPVLVSRRARRAR
jgi:hypothetical protein